jgi:hypothetical protein
VADEGVQPGDGDPVSDDVMAEVARVLVGHQRHQGGCLCGWGQLGASLTIHQAEALAVAGLLRPEMADEWASSETSYGAYETGSTLRSVMVHGSPPWRHRYVTPWTEAPR